MEISREELQEVLYDVARDYPKVRGKSEGIDTSENFHSYVKWVLDGIGFADEDYEYDKRAYDEVKADDDEIEEAWEADQRYEREKNAR